MWAQHRFLSFDKTPLFYRWRHTGEKPKAVVIIMHGMGEHGGRYEHLADHLAEFEIHSVIPDLRGFGQSGGQKVFVRRFTDYHEDLRAVHAWAIRQYPGVPLFLLGHSFGGLIVSSYEAFARGPAISGMILSSPLFGVGFPVPKWREILGQVASLLVPTFTQPTLVDLTKLTHDALLIREYSGDKFIDQRISARLYAEMNSMLRRKRSIAAGIHCPSLILQAGDDHIVSPQETQKFYDRLASEDKSIKIYPGFYHEILNETDRASVFSRIGAWIIQHTV